MDLERMLFMNTPHNPFTGCAPKKQFTGHSYESDEIALEGKINLVINIDERGCMNLSKLRKDGGK